MLGGLSQAIIKTQHTVTITQTTLDQKNLPPLFLSRNAQDLITHFQFLLDTAVTHFKYSPKSNVLS